MGVAEPNKQSRTEPTKELTDDDIVCLGHLQRVFPLLDRLREVGCERDIAGNRRLHFDEYCKLVLLYTWNPLIDSLRTLQRVVGLKRVAKALGIKRFSLGSFSEAPRIFEPELLREVIAELAGEVRALPQDPRLGDVKHALTLVDGTVLAALPRLARAAGENTRYGTTRSGLALHGWRLHMQLDLLSFTPHRVNRTGARNSGEGREAHVLGATLESNRCYVSDGGYGDSRLFDQIIDIGSSYVMRIRENSAFEVLEERLLSQEALDAEIVRDAIVQWGGKHKMRIIAVKITPRPARGGNASEPSDLLVIATSLLDLPAELVGLIYLNRYSVELFFRFLKQLLGMKHLISQREEGIDIQVYCAVIVCLLINLMTGKKPDKATVSMIGFYLMGLADAQEMLDHLNKPNNTGVKKRAKEEIWKKLGL